MTLSMVVEHLSMVVFAIVIAILIGVPLGLLCYLSRAARGVVLRVVDLIQTTPALALLKQHHLPFGICRQRIFKIEFKQNLIIFHRNIIL